MDIFISLKAKWHLESMDIYVTRMRQGTEPESSSSYPPTEPLSSRCEGAPRASSPLDLGAVHYLPVLHQV